MVGSHFERIRGYLIAIASAAVVTAGTVPVAQAGSSGRLHIAGRVLPRVDLWLSQLSFSFTGRFSGVSRVLLADLHLLGNGSKFTVSVLSRSAGSSERPALVDEGTGASVPYGLAYAGKPLSFSKGEASLAQATPDSTDHSAPLEIALPAGADLDKGKFQERLLLVVTAK